MIKRNLLKAAVLSVAMAAAAPVCGANTGTGQVAYADTITTTYVTYNVKIGEITVTDVTDTSMTVTFEKPTDNAEYVAGYTVSYQVNGEPSTAQQVSLGADEFSITLTGLLPDTSYYIAVSGVPVETSESESVSIGGQSVVQTTNKTDTGTDTDGEDTITPVKMDVKVKGLTISGPTQNSLTVKWTKSTDSYVTGYVIKYRKGTGGNWSTKTVSAGTSQCTLTKLSSNTKYQIKVCAKLDTTYATNATGSYTAIKTGTTTLPQVTYTPAKPKLKKATTTSLKITFAKVTGKESKQVAKRVVYYRVKGSNTKWKKVSVANNATSVVLKGLKQNTKYQIRMQGIGKSGKYKNGKYSKVLTARTLKKAYKTKITSIISPAKGKIKLTWKKATNAKKYVIYRATKKNGKYKKVATTKKTTYTDKGLNRSKTYYYKIKTVTADKTYATSKAKAMSKGKYKQLAKWYTGYNVNTQGESIPVYRVYSKSDHSSFIKAYNKVLLAAASKYNALAKTYVVGKTVTLTAAERKARIAAFPTVIVSQTYAVDAINKYRAVRYKETVARLKSEGWTNEEIQDVKKEGQLETPLSKEGDLEQYAALRAFEASRCSVSEFVGTDWFTSNPHTRPFGLSSYGCENYSTASGISAVEGFYQSDSHREALYVSNIGHSGFVVTCYSPFDLTYGKIESYTTRDGVVATGYETGTVMEIASKATTQEWVDAELK